MTDAERWDEHRQNLKVAEALGEEVQRADAEGRAADRDEILGALADGLPPDFVGRVLGVHLDDNPGASAEFAAAVPTDQARKVHADWVRSGKVSGDDWVDAIPADQAGSVYAGLIRSGKVSGDDLFVALAANRGITVDELKKRLGD